MKDRQIDERASPDFLLGTSQPRPTSGVCRSRSEESAMLSWFKPEQVQFVDLRQSELTFVSRYPKRPAPRKIRIPLSGGPRKYLDLTVYTLTSRPAGNNLCHLCIGRLALAPDEIAEVGELLERYATRCNLGSMARRSERIAIGLKVKSRELPGYCGLSVDLSRHGLGLSCSSALPPGRVLTLDIEPDSGHSHPLRLKGQVVWCREDHRQRRFLAGIEFIDLANTQSESLRLYLRQLERREQTKLLHRQLFDGEIIPGPGRPAA